LFVFIFAFFKKVDAYKSFSSGAADALKLILDILPLLATIFIAIQIFTASGLLDIFSVMLSPIFEFFGIPRELSTFIIIKPFSGNGSLVLFNEIVETFGADSYITKTASVIAGSSETIFYTSALYFSKTKIKNLGFALPIAVLTTFFASVLAAFVCRFI
jgi:spore maturation protein B